MHKKSELVFNLLLIPLDLVLVVLSFVLAYIIRVKIQTTPVAHAGITHYANLILIFAPIWLILFALLGLYTLSSGRGRIREITQVFLATSVGVMLIVGLDYLSKKPIFPAKAIPIYAWAISIVLVSLGRLIVWWIQRRLYLRGVGVRRVLLVGAHHSGEIILEEMERTKELGYEVVGVVDDSLHKGEHFNNTESLGRISEIDQIIRHHKVDEVLLAAPELDEGVVLSLIAYCEAAKVSFRYVPKLFGVYNINVGANVVGGIPVIEIRRTSLEGWGRVQKRIFDILGSIIGLILLSPFFLVMSIIIMLQGGGSPFFAHRRLGRHARQFNCYKFRSMVPDAERRLEKLLAENPKMQQEWERDFKLKDDPRITPVGKFLRKTSLDELPQLWNVLKGDMTLVGPRPIVEEELDKYGIYRHQVLTLKPGMTGLWQVSGRSDVSYEERVRLDAYYVENWSLWLDLKTILRTVKVLFSRHGAY